MDILCGGVYGKHACLQIVSNAFQSLNDQVRFTGLDDALAAKHGGMRDAALNILLRHAGVKSDGRIKVIYALVFLFGEASGPKFVQENGLLCGVLNKESSSETSAAAGE